jgi:hypothetical protein
VKEKSKTQVSPQHYTNAWISIFSIMMFFISFFGSYFVSGNEISVAFVKAVIVFFVSNLIARVLVFMWHISIPRDQWLLIVHGPPQVDSRQVRIQKERERLLADDTSDDDDDFASSE